MKAVVLALQEHPWQMIQRIARATRLSDGQVSGSLHRSMARGIVERRPGIVIPMGQHCWLYSLTAELGQQYAAWFRRRA